MTQEINAEELAEKHGVQGLALRNMLRAHPDLTPGHKYRHTWLLAQARAGRIPHHRLGHYVRFSADDLKQWLGDTRVGDSRHVGADSKLR